MKPFQRDYKPPFGGSLRSEKIKKRRARLLFLVLSLGLLAAWLYWRQEELKRTPEEASKQDSLASNLVSASLPAKLELETISESQNKRKNIFHLRWSKDSSFFSLMCPESPRKLCFQELSNIHPELPRAVMEQLAFLSPHKYWDSLYTLEADFQKYGEDAFLLAQVSFSIPDSSKALPFQLQRGALEAILDSNGIDTLLYSGKYCQGKSCKDYRRSSDSDVIGKMVLDFSVGEKKNVHWERQNPLLLKISPLPSEYFVTAIKTTLVDMSVTSPHAYSVILYCGNGNFLEIQNLKALKENLMLGAQINAGDTLGIFSQDSTTKLPGLWLGWNKLGINIPWDKNPELAYLLQEDDSDVPE